MDSWEEVSCELTGTVSTYHHVFILLENVKVSVLQGIIVTLDCIDWVLLKI